MTGFRKFVGISFGVIFGVLGGFLNCREAKMLAGVYKISVAFVMLFFLGGWILVTALVLRGAKTLTKVFRRGFLIGAALWFIMVPVGFVHAGRVASTLDGSEAAVAGAGAFGILNGGFTIAMSIGNLIGFAIAYLIGREMKSEANTRTKKCPECAELIKLEARKCRYCGANLEIKKPQLEVNKVGDKFIVNPSMAAEARDKNMH